MIGGRPRGRIPRTGFSLLELLVILVVLGILFRLTLPKLRAAAALYDFDRAVRQFAGDLREAQAEAWRRNRTVTVTRLSATQYKISFFAGAAETLLQQRAMPGGSAFSGTWNPIGFRSFGPPTLPVTAPMDIAVTNAGRSRTIRVTAGGAVAVLP